MGNWTTTAYHVNDDGKVQGVLEFDFQTRSAQPLDKKPYDLARRLYALRQNTEGLVVVNMKSIGVMELEPV